MTNTYKLVELAKAKTGIDSDYGISEMLGVDRQMVSGWKRQKSEANTINTLKLMKAANMSIDEGLKLMQGGFTSLLLIFVTALSSVALLASMAFSGHCILCKIDAIDSLYCQASNDEMFHTGEKFNYSL